MSTPKARPSANTSANNRKQQQQSQAKGTKKPGNATSTTQTTTAAGKGSGAAAASVPKKLVLKEDKNSEFPALLPTNSNNNSNSSSRNSSATNSPRSGLTRSINVDQSSNNTSPSNASNSVSTSSNVASVSAWRTPPTLSPSKSKPVSQTNSPTHSRSSSSVSSNIPPPNLANFTLEQSSADHTVLETQTSATTATAANHPPTSTLINSTSAHLSSQTLPSSTNDSLQATVEQLQRRLEQLSTETSKREEELYRTQKTLGEYAKTMERLHIENKQYIDDLKEERELSARHEELNLSLRQELSGLREELKAATLANAEMLDETENRTQWEEEIATIRDMLLRKEREVKELETRNALLLEQIDKLESTHQHPGNQSVSNSPSFSKGESFSKGDLQVIIESHQTMPPSASVTGDMQRSTAARRKNDLLDSGKKEKSNKLKEPLLQGEAEAFDDSGCCCVII